MSSLLLRLAGPMQSWGYQSRFSHRDTGREPTKSGVIGLLCAALGWPRDEPNFPITGITWTLESLAKSLRMAVRVDREGILRRDFHTAQNVMRADTKGRQDTVISQRDYLADACFLVALVGERPLLDELAAALERPVWNLFLGRKAFVPEFPLLLGVVDEEPATLFERIAWQGSDHNGQPTLRVIEEIGFEQSGEPRMDVPLSFARGQRTFALRQVRSTMKTFDSVPIINKREGLYQPCI